MAATSLSAPDASKVEGDQAELTNDTSNNGSAAQMQAEGTGIVSVKQHGARKY